MRKVTNTSHDCHLKHVVYQFKSQTTLDKYQIITEQVIQLSNKKNVEERIV